MNEELGTHNMRFQGQHVAHEDTMPCLVCDLTDEIAHLQQQVETLKKEARKIMAMVGHGSA